MGNGAVVAPLTLAELSPSESVCRTFMEASAKYLYDVKAYDSDLELEDIGCDAIDVPEVESVTVYGKIPTKSVAIPTIMGGTYSPDFMYVVKRKGVREELNVVIEVKDAEKDADLHKSEDMKIKCAEVFYNMLRDDGIDVRHQRQLKNQKLRDVIAPVIEKFAGPEIKVAVDEREDRCREAGEGGEMTWRRF